MSGSGTLEKTLIKVKVTNEEPRSMFLSHDQSQVAIPRIDYDKDHDLSPTLIP